MLIADRYAYLLVAKKTFKNDPAIPPFFVWNLKMARDALKTGNFAIKKSMGPKK